MCIICDEDYDINMIYLDCSGCKFIKEIPKELINLFKLDCSYTKIKKIPKELVNLEYLDCTECFDIKEIPKELINLIQLNSFDTGITKIPKELVNLESLTCSNTGVNEIPKELVNLVYLECHYTGVVEIPKELVNFRDLNCFHTCIQDKSWLKTEDEVKKIIKLQIYWKKYGKLYLKLPTLWKIAEYYTKKKYAPDNIMKYIIW